MDVAGYRAEEAAAARAKLEKEKREIQSLLQETQDDLESEKEARMKVEKQRRTLNDELENLRDSLEESESSTAAQQEIRTQRENELAHLKKTLEEETSNHEAVVTGMRGKHAKVIEDLNEQLEAAKKVKGHCQNRKCTIHGFCLLSTLSSPRPLWRRLRASC